MLYTAVVGADASIGPYKQVKNSCHLRGSLCETDSPDTGGGGGTKCQRGSAVSEAD